MKMPNDGDVEAAFGPYLEADETLKHWAYGVEGPPPLFFFPLYLVGILPGVLAKALLTTPYLFGLTERRLVVLRFRGYLNVKESFAYALEKSPPVRSKRTLYAATLSIDDAERPLAVRFGLFTAHNSDQHVRGILNGLQSDQRGEQGGVVKKEETLSDRFNALRKDLSNVLGDEPGGAFLDMPIYHRRGATPYVAFGEGYAPDSTRDGTGYLTACRIKNTVFDNVFDIQASCWFVFTDSLYEGTYSEYGPLPPEALSIWDEPGLLPRTLKADAEYRDIVKVDPYTLNGQVYRQWLLWAKPTEIGIDTLHQASARVWNGPHVEPGPRYRGSLFCLQPGRPLVFLANVYDAACVLLSQSKEALRPYTHQYEGWVTASSP